MTIHTQLPVQPDISIESILVVKREHFFVHGPWDGLHTNNLQHYLDIVADKKEFLPRNVAEQNAYYKQIIPYLIFTHADEIFVMQRSANATETRLKNKYTIGIGGHIRQEDIRSNDLFHWADREFHEEVLYDGSMAIEPLGILNDDSNDVGKVHIGFVFLLHGNSNVILVRSELKSGNMMKLESCIALQPQFETWSQICLRQLIDTRSRGYSSLS